MRRGSNQEKSQRNEQKNNRFIRPPNKLIEMSTHPGSDIEKQEKSPSGNAQKTRELYRIQLPSYSRRTDAIIIPGIDKATHRDCQRHQERPFPTNADDDHIEDEILKKRKSEPISALQGAQLMEELWRRSQQKQEDKRWYDLHHELMANIFQERPLGH